MNTEAKDAKLKGLMEEMLTVREHTLALMDYGVKREAAKHGADRETEEFISRRHRANVERVYDFCESPLERRFINALIAAFIARAPLHLVVLGSKTNAPEWIRWFRGYYRRLGKLRTLYEERRGDSTIEGFCASLKAADPYIGLNEEEIRIAAPTLRNYHGGLLYDKIHVIPQAGFPDIKVDGKSIRADALFWIPGDKRLKLVVEFDGYEYHSDRAAFERDKRRDRALKAAGYEVMRFAGSEIVSRPLVVAGELFSYLMKWYE